MGLDRRIPDLPRQLPFQTPEAEQFHTDDSIETGLGNHGLDIEFIHAFFVVRHLIQVDILFFAVFFTLDPGTGAGLTFHHGHPDEQDPAGRQPPHRAGLLPHS